MENIARRHLAKRGLAVLAAVVAEQFPVRWQRLRIATQLTSKRFAANCTDQSVPEVPGRNKSENTRFVSVTIANEHLGFVAERTQLVV
jgi:hypothetical protein